MPSAQLSVPGQETMSLSSLAPGSAMPTATSFSYSACRALLGTHCSVMSWRSVMRMLPAKSREMSASWKNCSSVTLPRRSLMKTAL